MDSPLTSVPPRIHTGTRPRTVVTVVAVLTALCSIGFAGANVVLEVIDRPADAGYARYVAEYPVGFAVMNWLVVALKLGGAAVAILSVSRSTFVRPGALGVMLWAGFATLGVYALGSVVEGVAMVFGLMGGIDRIGPAELAYVAFFLLFAAGFGVLAVSYARRHDLGMRHVLLGVLGAPIVLGTVLFALPTLMGAFGLLPTA